VIMIIGAGIALATGGRTPVEIIILLQAIIIIAVPVTCFMLFWECNNKKLMQSQTPRWWVNVLAVGGLLTICLLALNTLNRLIGLIGKPG